MAIANRHATLIDAGRWELWFALLGGAVAWTVHLLAAYAIAEFGCVSGWGRIHFIGINAVSWMVIAVSIITLAVALAGVYVAVRIRQRLPDAADDADGRNVSAFMARTGFATSLIFAFIILVESIPILFYLREC